MGRRGAGHIVAATRLQIVITTATTMNTTIFSSRGSVTEVMELHPVSLGLSLLVPILVTGGGSMYIRPKLHPCATKVLPQ